MKLKKKKDQIFFFTENGFKTHWPLGTKQSPFKRQKSSRLG